MSDDSKGGENEIPIGKEKGFGKSLSFSKLILVPGLVALVALPYVLGKLHEAETDYKTSAEEIRKGASFWLDLNEKYRGVMEKEFDQLLQLTKDSVDAATLARQSLQSASVTHEAFESALRLYRNECRLIFDVDDAHIGNPWPPPENLRYRFDADRTFDTLCKLESSNSTVLSSVAAISNFRKSNDLKKTADPKQDSEPKEDNADTQKPSLTLSDTLAEKLSELDLFSGILIKLMVAITLPDSESPRYFDRIEELLATYKAEFVDKATLTDSLPPREYPDDLPIDQRKSFANRRCECYYHYLRGRLADRLHEYRAAIAEYETCRAKDEDSRNNPTRYSLIFYRPDYAVTSALESLLQRSSLLVLLNRRQPQYAPGMAPLDEWWSDLENLNSSMARLRGLFQAHPTLESSPGYPFVVLSSIEWSAFGSSGSLSDWDIINETYIELLKQISTYSNASSFTIQTLLAHRLALKAILTGYQKNYFPDNFSTSPYTALEIEAINTICSSISKQDWRQQLVQLRTKLTLQRSLDGIPLGINLRLRADIDQMLSQKDDSIPPVRFPERMTMQMQKLASNFDTPKDDVAEQLSRLEVQALETESRHAAERQFPTASDNDY